MNESVASKLFGFALALFYLPGCSHSPGDTNQSSKHFADAYYQYDEPLAVNPTEDTILFLRKGHVLTPFLAVVKGKFIPFFSGAVDIGSIKHLKVFAMASIWGGADIQTGREAEFEITPCSYPHFLPTDKRYNSIAIYANRPVAIEIKSNPGRCVMGVEIGGDTYNTSSCVGTFEWTTDLNRNGRLETWIHYPAHGNWVQVWENFGQPESALLVDTEHPALEPPDRKTCNNSHLFRTY